MLRRCANGPAAENPHTIALYRKHGVIEEDESARHRRSLK